MKLINRIILHISWVLTLLLAAWASLFYFAMVDEINDEVDDSLEFYSEMLITRSLAGRELPSSSSGSNNSYYLREVTSDYADSHPSVAYSDEEIYIPEMEESEPARVPLHRRCKPQLAALQLAYLRQRQVQRAQQLQPQQQLQIGLGIVPVTVLAPCGREKALRFVKPSIRAGHPAPCFQLRYRHGHRPSLSSCAAMISCKAALQSRTFLKNREGAWAFPVFISVYLW